MLTDESEPLYNRIMLKTFMKGSLPKQYCRMHDEDWYEKRDIDLKLNTKVTSVDTDSKVVELDYGGNLEYDYLLIASGGSPRKLDFIRSVVLLTGFALGVTGAMILAHVVVDKIVRFIQ